MRHSIRTVLPALAFTALVPATAAAQACLGNPSFATNHLQLAGDYTFSSDFDQLGASFVSGSNTVFAGLGANSYSYRGGDPNLRLAGTLGYQVPITSSSRVQACPLLRASYGLATDDYNGTGGELTTRSYGFGLALGGTLLQRPRFALVPSVQASVQRDAFTVRGGFAPDDVNDTYGLLGVALGFVMSESLSLRPSVQLPLNASFDEPLFGIGLSLNYGRRR
ncbi:hypothetical protein Strain138_001508 [Pseudogemmatithrix spongiicola]|uniref:Outer membrane protein beta-barrel domain-containing protein n=1 Tax=Pseudogemmatithrix spongiicola TaxID=3062599 RepID=A0AA49Q8I4_9BACT|nr:hypothetical protein Strain138_001508 [Gemmatimonadaceae bacterium 'strain 138']WKW15135.1 hypothetical protein Strain318_001508 [Gemmatimonadaceae bacterium 'strain 318']